MTIQLHRHLAVFSSEIMFSRSSPGFVKFVKLSQYSTGYFFLAPMTPSMPRSGLPRNFTDMTPGGH
jgi:hypothetical protein